MELPREPTTIPQARRYPRTFAVDYGNIYKENDKVIINIPPIKNAYLTKDVKLNFQLAFTYTEMTPAEATALLADVAVTNANDDIKKNTGANYFGYSYAATNVYTKLNTKNPLYALTKPIPTFDVNGPYGLISRIQVYDYLGNTLLEDIPAHDVLTAQFADTWFSDENLDIERPYISDINSNMRKPPCAYIVDQDFLQTPLSCTLTYDTSLKIQMENVVVTKNVCIDLFSFLGKLSDKFVPLHNGFRIELSLNKLTNAIKFQSVYNSVESSAAPTVFTGLPSLRFFKPGATATITTRNATPSIIDHELNRFALSTTILEVSPELDSKIDKIVYCQGWKYQQDYYTSSTFVNGIADGLRSDTTKRIIPDLKSVTKVFIGQRPFNTLPHQQSLGYRIKNYVDEGVLTYNKSIVGHLKSIQDVFTAYKNCNLFINPYINEYDFSVEEEMTGEQGIALGSGYAFYIQQKYVSPANDWMVRTSGKLNVDILRNTSNQGRYLLCFDTRIPGATPNSIAGIDTSKNVLEYTLKSKSTTLHKVYIDVFVQHDAIIHVNPGESTAVSF